MLLKKYSILLCIASMVIFSACKKNTDATSTATTADDKVKDTVVLDSKDIYLWYNQIPATFNGRSYDDPNKIMEAIRQYSVVTGFTNSVDRWSFGIKKTDWNNLSSGISDDFGLGVFFFADGDLRVKSVESQSAAGHAGIHRGWRVKKINGSTNITIANSDFIVANVFNSTQTSFTFTKPDGNDVDISLTASTYNEQPVYVDTVYSINASKIGYLVFNSFLGDTTQINSTLQNIFNYFVAQNVTDVIVDLRYNGGGFVSLSEKLADYLAPSAANGGLMMKQQYNDKYTQYNSTTYFKKAGSLNLNHVFFIVTDGTASASELLINNLKPYMTEKLVGPKATHGKPVGFFPIPVGDWYIFPVSFKTTNKNNEGSYFNGLPLDNQVADGLDMDWGDIRESCLASVIKYITTGTFTVQHNGAETFNKPEIQRSNSILDAYSFKGAVGKNILSR